MDTTSAAHEGRRNALLRRADWRFLLPNVRPAKSICFANGLLATSIREFSDDVIDGLSISFGDRDLAVAVNPNGATLARAREALHAGGFCYTEWHPPTTMRLEGVRKRLEAAGFCDIRCYWPWPPPSREPSAFWLPLDAPRALHYFLSTRPPPRGLRHRVLRVLWRLGLRLGLMAPICAVARKPIGSGGEAASDGALEQAGGWGTEAADADPELFDMIPTDSMGWRPGLTRSDLSMLLLTGGPRSISKAVALIFADRDTQPRLAIKMPRVPESRPGLLREAATLEAVQGLRPDGVRGAPRVAFLRQSSDFLALGETALTGVPVYTMLRRDNYRDLALQATTWLEDLIGHPEVRPPEAWWSRLVEPVFVDFAESFGPVLDRNRLRETREILTALGPLPLVCEQGDFSPWNVLRTADGELVVVDWESAELEGLPGQDLIYFLTYLAFFLDGAMDTGNFRDSYRAVLDRSTFTGSVARECLEHYACSIDLDVDILHPLRLLVWLRCSRFEYQRLGADAGERPKPALLRRGLFLSLWEEELRHGARA